MTIRNALIYSAAAVALCWQAPGASEAQAQGVVNAKRLSAVLAGEAVATAVKACADQKFSVSAVLVDTGGIVQAALRGDNAGPENASIANDKAFTSVTFGQDTAEMVERAKTSPPPSAFSKIPHLLLAPGGVVIKVGDEVVGALGVSGAPNGTGDGTCAKAGLDKISDRLK